MAKAEDLLKSVDRLREEGRLMSAVHALEEARLLTDDPSTQVFAAFNLAGIHFQLLGNGNVARREANAVGVLFEIFGREKISKGLWVALPKAVSLALTCAMSFEEFEALADRLKALTPDAANLTQIAPQVRHARDKGEPWSDQLFDFAMGDQRTGRYAEARSTYQLLLSNRVELNLTLDDWRTAANFFGFISWRVIEGELQAHGGYKGKYPPDEFLPILTDAMPLLDEYLAANPHDADLAQTRRDMDGFVAKIQGVYAAQHARR